MAQLGDFDRVSTSRSTLSWLNTWIRGWAWSYFRNVTKATVGIAAAIPQFSTQQKWTSCATFQPPTSPDTTSHFLKQFLPMLMLPVNTCHSFATRALDDANMMVVDTLLQARRMSVSIDRKWTDIRECNLLNW